MNRDSGVEDLELVFICIVLLKAVWFVDTDKKTQTFCLNFDGFNVKSASLLFDIFPNFLVLSVLEFFNFLFLSSISTIPFWECEISLFLLLFLLL